MKTKQKKRMDRTLGQMVKAKVYRQNHTQKQYCNKFSKDVKNGPHQKKLKEKQKPAKRQKQLKCPPMDEWINNMYNIHTIEYYSALKRKF